MRLWYRLRSLQYTSFTCIKLCCLYTAVEHRLSVLLRNDSSMQWWHCVLRRIFANTVIREGHFLKLQLLCKQTRGRVGLRPKGLRHKRSSRQHGGTQIIKPYHYFYYISHRLRRSEVTKAHLIARFSRSSKSIDELELEDEDEKLLRM